MKTTALCPLISVLCLLLFSGCSSLPRQIAAAIPDGRWATIDGTITGKFSATKFNGAGVEKTGDHLTARELHIRHSNAWVPLIEFNVVGEPAAK